MPEPHPFLSAGQQDLLLAALHSQARLCNPNPSLPGDRPSIKRSPSDEMTSSMINLDADPLFTSPQNADLDNYNDFTADLDYLDGDNSFDFDNADLGGEMIGALPGGANDSAIHDKRKSPDENTELEEGDAKRQETLDGEKGAKKPGRKPLTSEPTTKRKAQNRAAQRAFRERKEKHVKDLEVKVTELTKAQEADEHEKSRLKAEVERLNTELRDARKRLSLSGGVSHSPPLRATGQRSTSGSDFHFDFPRFGALPGSQTFGDPTYVNSTKQENASPPTLTPASTASFTRHSARQSTAGSAISPSVFDNLMPTVGYSTNNNMHGFANTLPLMGSNDALGDLFTPSVLRSDSIDGNNYFVAPPTTTTGSGDESTAGLNRVFQFNSGSSVGDSASPGDSSSSQWNANGANSSCGTSPEPLHDSPQQKDKPLNSFSERAQPAQSWNQIKPDLAISGNNNNNNNNTNSNVPFTNTFDPVLFGDYRDPSEPFLNNNDFGSGFFDEALNPAPFDLGSPSNLFGILQSPTQNNAQLSNNAPTPSRNLMAEVEKNRDGGDDESLTTTKQEKKLISCNNIWNQLQSNPDYQDGKFDLDNLCSELRSKARCSESGVMVREEHVEAALRKLGGRETLKNNHSLMFEQESWDSVVKKMGGGAS